MALKLIGSGLGRTGTFSLKLALEALGLGPCHHMVEVFAHPETMPLWVAAADGKSDWDLIFRGYASVTDYPGAAFWREIINHYPTAKVLHTVRDPEAWFESTQATIFAERSVAAAPPPPLRAFFEAVTRDLTGRLHDRAFMIDYFQRHTAEVLQAVPKERLLVYQVSEGWAPLCDFLGVTAPATPFPRENTREAFQARAASHSTIPSPEEMRAMLGAGVADLDTP